MQQIKRLDDSKPFHTPMPTNHKLYAEYKKFIPHPLSFQHIERKLNAKPCQYKSYEQFDADMKRVFATENRLKNYKGPLCDAINRRHQLALRVENYWGTLTAPYTEYGFEEMIKYEAEQEAKEAKAVNPFKMGKATKAAKKKSQPLPIAKPQKLMPSNSDDSKDEELEVHATSTAAEPIATKSDNHNRKRRSSVNLQSPSLLGAMSTKPNRVLSGIKKRVRREEGTKITGEPPTKRQRVSVTHSVAVPISSSGSSASSSQSEFESASAGSGSESKQMEMTSPKRTPKARECPESPFTPFAEKSSVFKRMMGSARELYDYVAPRKLFGNSGSEEDTDEDGQEVRQPPKMWEVDRKYKVKFRDESGYGSSRMERTVMVRAGRMDFAVKKFAQLHPDGKIISCGLVD